MSEPITSASGTPAWSRSAARRPRVSWLQRLLGVATAATLAVDAYVHLHDAGSYDSVTSSVLSEATLFRTQAILAALVAVALVLRPRPVAWAVAVLVAAAAIGAVLLYTYVDVGALGPLPDMYEPTWNLPGKAASAYAEAAAVLLALSGFVVALRDDRRAARTGPSGITSSTDRPAGRPPGRPATPAAPPLAAPPGGAQAAGQAGATKPG